MRRMCLLAFLVIFLFGGVSVSFAFDTTDTLTGRELTVCEPNGIPHNYFEIDTFVGPLTTDVSPNIVVFDVRERLADVKGVQLSISSFFEDTARGTVKFTSVCSGEEMGIYELEHIWAVTPRVVNGEIRLDVKDARDTLEAERYGIRIPSGDRQDILGRSPLGSSLQLISDPGSITPTEPNIRGLKQGTFRFDYKLTFAGRKSSGELETEMRTFRVYLLNSNSLSLSALRELYGASSDEEITEDVAKEIDRIIDNGQLDENGIFVPEQQRQVFAGASTFIPAPAASSCGRRDVNGDGVVNIIDLVTVARRFGSYSAGLAEDVNSDGRVNIVDLVLVARQFGQICQPTTGYVPAGERVVFVPVPVAKQSQNTGFASVLKSIFWVIGNR